jgi:hypothetical protein
MPPKKGANTKASATASGEVDMDLKHTHQVSLLWLTFENFFDELSDLEKT